ncbi:hypothetical protein [Streptomyces sp. NBRC 110611]|uniref:hypothetical protein n=1 Tax=Streptomyces sp. NBRC 110611 TaxID=1621259 RepID=UPI0015EF3CFE|nr:hypothetical protein [Streptomyces sp. NBRC 110611]
MRAPARDHRQPHAAATSLPAAKFSASASLTGFIGRTSSSLALAGTHPSSRTPPTSPSVPEPQQVPEPGIPAVRRDKLVQMT